MLIWCLVENNKPPTVHCLWGNERTKQSPQSLVLLAVACFVAFEFLGRTMSYSSALPLAKQPLSNLLLVPEDYAHVLL